MPSPSEILSDFHAARAEFFGGASLEYADVKIPVVASRLSASGTLTPGGVDVSGLVSVRAPRDAFRALPRVGDFVFLDGRRFIVDAVEDLVGSPLVRLALR